jgi:nitrogen fixation NifU-like protein
MSSPSESHGNTPQVVFSLKVIEHAGRPKYIGRMEQPDGSSAVCGWCGEVMEFYVRMHGTTIAEASFMADGCVSTMACGDMLAEMAQGTSIQAAEAITPQELQAALGGLPYANQHCSELAVSALREALDDVKVSQDTDT